MLVLSRRLDEKIVFPELATTVQVVAIKPGVVRLGIEAPPEVAVFREEVIGGAAGPKRAAAPAPTGSALHAVRNRVNSATLGLALLQQQLKSGLTQAAENTVTTLGRELQALRDHIETGAGKQPEPRSRLRRALLVEDDQNERELMAGFLRLAGLHVATANDGADALDYLRTQSPPDVVLLDMVLPRCDGAATVREIRRNPALSGLKVFAVTGHTPDRFGFDSRSSGIDRWFLKPLQPESFLRDLTAELSDSP